MKTDTQLLSVNKAAARLGLTGGRIRQLLQANEIRGQKINARAWAISDREIERYAKASKRELLSA